MSAIDPPPVAEQAPLACPRCGAALRPDQDWCLACGAAVTTHVAGAPGWRTPVAVVGVVLLLAAVGLVVAFLELSDDADRVARAPTATPAASPQPDVSPAPTPPASPTPGPTGPSGPSGPTGPTGSTAAQATVTPSPTPARPFAGGTSGPTGGTTPGSGSTGTVASWPAGRDAWTVILKSASSRAEADKRAKELQAQGKSVGVLNSSDYKSLRAGYWVVFSGQYEDRAAAQSAANGWKSTVPEAYARYVSD